MATEPLYRAVRLSRFSYLTRGRYAEQLERWFDHFDQSQVLILRSEDMFNDPPEIYASILEFLDLRAWLPGRFENQSHRTRPKNPDDDVAANPISDASRAWLRNSTAM